MTEVSLDELQRHVEQLHDCQATHRGIVAVREDFEGQVAWEGTVHLYSLSGHPSALLCYAWSSPVEGSENRRFYAVLRNDAIDSAARAVQAAILSDHRAQD